VLHTPIAFRGYLGLATAWLHVITNCVAVATMRYKSFGNMQCPIARGPETNDSWSALSHDVGSLCWNDGRGPRLAHPAQRLETLHDVDLGGRRLIHAQDLANYHRRPLA
jgi:hypothetical protein